VLLASVFAVLAVAISAASVPAAEPSDESVMSGFAKQSDPPVFSTPEEAVDAFRAALEKRDRTKVPLDWASTQNSIGIALHTLSERDTNQLTKNVKASPALQKLSAIRREL